MVVEPAEIVAYIVFFIICQFVTLEDYVILELVESGTEYANITGQVGIFFGSSNQYGG
jgi:hypothetical protein